MAKTKTSYDWAAIEKRWIRFEGSFAAFCRSEGVPISTAKSHGLAKLDKKTARKDAKAKGREAREALARELADENAADYVKALKAGGLAVRSVLELALESFVSMSTEGESAFRSAAEPGRLTLKAATELRDIYTELLGIPDRNEVNIWPMTRGFWPWSYQRDFVFDFPTSIKEETGEDIFIFAFIGGIGSGKTFCGAQKAGELASRNRGKVGMILAPTYRMLEDATKKTFFDVLRQKGVSFRYLKTENAVVLWGDTKILFRSLDDPDKLRGPNIAWAWMDEVGQLRDRSAFDVVLGRVRDREATEPAVILTTTPDGLNWLHDVCVLKAKENHVRLYHGRTADNPALPDGYVTRLSDVYDERFSLQELGGEFVNIFAGQAYWNYSRAKHVVPHKKLLEIAHRNRHLPLVLVCDFNVDPMCWNVGIEVPFNGDVATYWIDELHLRTASTEAAAKEYCRRWGKWKAGVIVFGDSAGWSSSTRSTVAHRTDYEIIETILVDNYKEILKVDDASAFVEIEVGTYNPREYVRVGTFNARLKNNLGVRKMFFSDRLKHTIADLEQVVFISGSRQLDKSNKELTHHSDAIGYYTHKKFPIGGPRISRG